MSEQNRRGLDESSIKDYLSVLAEGFGDLLGRILGYTSILKERFENESRTISELNVIMGSGERAQGLAKLLKDFSRSDKQNKVLCPLNASLKEAIDLLFCTLPQSIQIRSHFSEECCLVLVDQAHLIQFIMILGVYARNSLLERGGIIFFKTDRYYEKTESENGSFSSTGARLELLCLPNNTSDFHKNEKNQKSRLLASSKYEEFVLSHDLWVKSFWKEEGKGFEVYFPGVQNVENKSLEDLFSFKQCPTETMVD